MEKDEEYEAPDLSDMPVSDLVPLMLACSMSNDKSDQAFARACRDEIARKKDGKE